MALFLSNLLLAISAVSTPLTTIISNRDKGLPAAYDEIPLAKHAYCVEHISRNLQTKFGMRAWVVFNTHLRFVYAEEKFQLRLQKLEEASPQAADYVQRIDTTMWANPFLIAKRYGHNTSNLVEIMNSWIINKRRLSITDLLHALWSKCMDLRFHHL